MILTRNATPSKSPKSRTTANPRRKQPPAHGTTTSYAVTPRRRGGERSIGKARPPTETSRSEMCNGRGSGRGPFRTALSARMLACTVICRRQPSSRTEGTVAACRPRTDSARGRLSSEPHRAIRAKAAGSTAVVRGPAGAAELAVTTGVANSCRGSTSRDGPAQGPRVGCVDGEHHRGARLDAGP